MSKSKQLEHAIPASTISSLSSGEFVGIVADNPDQCIELKPFHCRITNGIEATKKERHSYNLLSIVRQVDEGVIQANFQQIKADVHNITDQVMERLLNDPATEHLIVKK